MVHLASWFTILSIYLLLTIGPPNTCAARILAIFPLPLYSHQNMYHNIMRMLEDRGHDLVIVTPMPKNSTYTRAKQIDVSFLAMHAQKFAGSLKHSRLFSLVESLHIRNAVADEFFKHPEIFRLIKGNQKFDLVLLEWAIHPALSLIPAKLKCPLIGIRSLGMPVDGHDSVANPIHPAYLSAQYYEADFSLFGRVQNVGLLCLYRLLHSYYTGSASDRIKRKYFPMLEQTVSEMEKNVSLILLNTSPLLSGPRPMVPSIIEIGGIGLTEFTPLPADIKAFLDSAEKGAVVISFGSFIDDSFLPKNMNQWIIEASIKMPYKIIWKTSGLEHKNSTNLMVLEWLPQPDIIGHRNIKLLVSHCGLHSTEEAVNYQVPILALPIFADQFHNADRITKLGIGLRLDRQTITKESFFDDVENIISNSSFQNQAKEVRRLWLDRPMSPNNKAVWWIEFTLRNKGVNHLKVEGVNLPSYQYFMLDILVILMLAYTAVVIVGSYTAYKVFILINKLKLGKGKIKTC